MNQIFALALSILASTVIAQANSLPPIQLGKSDSIVIVGGGPAGVHYATLLAKRGFTKITILEATDSVGGKSKTVMDPLGFPHELGTCYAHGLYTPVFNLISEYDPTNKLIPFVPTVKGHTWIHKDGTEGYVDYNVYLLQTAINNIGPMPMNDPVMTMSNAFNSYIQIHRSIFGVYEYGLPPQPSDWSLLNMTALEFIKKNNLLVIEGFFRYVFQQQGYGSLDNTPVFYMLWWIHPDVILKRLQQTGSNQAWVYMLSKGYKSLWKAMVTAYPDQIKVQLNTRVTQITRNAAVVSLTVNRDNGAPDVINCDHLVMAVDLSQNAPLPTDMQSTDKSLFEDKFSASTFVVTLYESDSLSRESVSDWWPNRGVGSSQGRLQLTRNTRLALFNPLPSHGSPADKIPTDWGVNATGRQARIAYQYFSRNARATDAKESETQLMKDLKEVNMTNPQVRTQFVFNYAPRYNQSMLERGTLWKILAQQGRFRTTWIGSSVSFESVLDVVTYNNHLIERVKMT